MTTGTSHFVNFTKACDYYKDYESDATPAELERIVRRKIDEGQIDLGQPEIKQGETLSWKIMADPSYPEGLHPLHHNRYIATEAMGVEGDDFDGEGSLICALRDQSCQEADAKLIVASVNHAEKLAEALRDLYENNSVESQNRAAETLAAYEAAQ